MVTLPLVRADTVVTVSPALSWLADGLPVKGAWHCVIAMVDHPSRPAVVPGSSGDLGQPAAFFQQHPAFAVRKVKVV